MVTSASYMASPFDGDPRRS